jgi:tetratricopeptide (TPR) repeat protein
MSAERSVAIPTAGGPRAERHPVAPAVGAAILVFLFALLLYGRTAYRTVPFWDSGEFIATSAILGIPHQPSTPLYVLIGRLATLVPGGSVAFRVNFLSSIANALAACFTVLWTARLAARAGLGPTASALSGALAGLLIAGSATLWTSANEAEVYALSTMIAALAAWAIVRAADARQADLRIALAVVYLLALAIAIHLGTLLVLPPLAWFAFRSGLLGIRTLRPRPLAVFCALFLLGLSVHLFLPIRAALDPAINEGDPADWQRFIATLTRAQYPPSNPLLRRGALAYQFGPMFCRYLGEQWPIVRGALGGILWPLAALAGLGLFWRRERRGGELLLLLVLIAGPALVFYLNFTEHEVRERDYFFALFFQTVAVLAGLAGGFLVAWLGADGGRKRGGRVAVGALLLVLVALAPIRNGFRTHDKHANRIARDYGANLLTPLPPSTILFTNGDNDTFPLWYLQEVEGLRKDVRVVNLSLLNTPWYIQQLRDQPPRVPIAYSDAEAAALRPTLDARGRVKMVKDFAVAHILAENRQRLPLYLAVTVPDRMGLDDRLKVEGLAMRIYAEPQTGRLDLEVARRNAYEVFTPLHGILTPDGRSDSTFYRDANETNLIQNYAAIHFYLGVEYDRRGDLAAATREAERALAISPSFVGNRLFLGLLYEKAADWARAEGHYRASLAVSPGDPRLLHRLGRVLAEQGRSAAAVPILKEAIARGREDYFDPFGSLFEVYWRAGQRDSALQVLDQWLIRHPGDQEILAVRERAALGAPPPGAGGGGS